MSPQRQTDQCAVAWTWAHAHTWKRPNHQLALWGKVATLLQRKAEGCPLFLSLKLSGINFSIYVHNPGYEDLFCLSEDLWGFSGLTSGYVFFQMAADDEEDKESDHLIIRRQLRSNSCRKWRHGVFMCDVIYVSCELSKWTNSWKIWVDRCHQGSSFWLNQNPCKRRLHWNHVGRRPGDESDQRKDCLWME